MYLTIIYDILYVLKVNGYTIGVGIAKSRTTLSPRNTENQDIDLPYNRGRHCPQRKSLQSSFQ